MACALTSLARMNITSMLEVGTWAGWTGLFASAFLKQMSAVKLFRSASVDVQDIRNSCIQALSKSLGFPAMKLRGVDQTITLDDMPEKIDLCYIDGDHSYKGVH